MNLTPNEVLLVALVALLVLGPKRLPIVMRRAGQIFSRLRHWTTDVRQEFDAAISPPVVEQADPPKQTDPADSPEQSDSPGQTNPPKPGAAKPDAAPEPTK